MGWQCSINLYLSPSKLGDALREVARALIPSPGLLTGVTLPGGDVLLLPLRPLGSGPVVLGRESAWFDVAVRVPTDAVTDEWWDEEPIVFEGRECITLDGLHLIVGVGERFAELSFSATTKAASHVLFESPSAHKHFDDLLRLMGGLAGAILTDTVVEVRDLTRPSRLIDVDWDWVRADEEAHFLDRLAQQVVEGVTTR